MDLHTIPGLASSATTPGRTTRGLRRQYRGVGADVGRRRLVRSTCPSRRQPTTRRRAIARATTCLPRPVCLDAATGKRIWYFQFVHHGIWGLTADGAYPARRDGERQAGEGGCAVTSRRSRMSSTRATGRPVADEERPVPQSDVPGERTAATRCSRPSPLFDRQGVRKTI